MQNTIEIFKINAKIIFSRMKKNIAELENSSKQFSRNYEFSDYAQSIWKKLFSEIKHMKNVKYLEIGVFEGRSLLWVWDNILPQSSVEIDALDSFPVTGTKERFIENVSQLIKQNIVRISHGTSESLIKNLPLNYYDLIYLDAGHSYKNVWNDTISLWPRLKPGGYLVLDDYFWKKFELPLADRPEMAINDLLKESKGCYVLLHQSLQVYLQKINALPSHLVLIDVNSLQIPKGGLVLPSFMLQNLKILIHLVLKIKRKIYNPFI